MTSVKFRLNALFVLIISALLLVFGAINYNKTKGKLEASVDHQVDATLARLSASLPGSIWNFDKSQIDQGLNAEMAATFISGIVIKNGDKIVGSSTRGPDGKLISAAQTPASDFTKSVELSFVDEGKANSVGKVTVYGSYEEINQALREELLWAILQILVLDIIIVLSLSRILSSVVLDPLAQIGLALNDIAQGDADLTKRIPRAKTDEFNQVSDSFNTFMARCKAS